MKKFTSTNEVEAKRAIIELQRTDFATIKEVKATLGDEKPTITKWYKTKENKWTNKLRTLSEEEFIEATENTIMLARKNYKITVELK